MTEVVDQLPETMPRTVETPAILLLPRPRSVEVDLTDALCRVLHASSEPLTPSKIRAQLPAPFRRLAPESVLDCLGRQVEAGVLYAFCPYRSQQPRYWHRPMPDHIAALIAEMLGDGPLTWSQLLRKLPEYAHVRAQEVLLTQLAQGRLHRHPGSGPRGGERYGVQPPDPRGPLRRELARVFARLNERLGFSEAQLRAAALEVLQEDEWASTIEAPSDEPSYQE